VQRLEVKSSIFLQAQAALMSKGAAILATPRNRSDLCLNFKFPNAHLNG
jgi:hypothetical protein